MKYGINLNTYNSIKEIINNNKKFTFKLFGSRAKGTYKENSDIDIAIFKNLTKEEEYKIRDEFDKLNIIYKVDLVFINEHTKKELLQTILKEGVDF